MEQGVAKYNCRECNKSVRVLESPEIVDYLCQDCLIDPITYEEYLKLSEKKDKSDQIILIQEIVNKYHRQET